MTISEFKNEADVLQLIHGQMPESLHLDYKQSDALEQTPQKRLEVAKDAAMATALQYEVDRL